MWPFLWRLRGLEATSNSYGYSYGYAYGYIYFASAALKLPAIPLAIPRLFLWVPVVLRPPSYGVIPMAVPTAIAIAIPMANHVFCPRR